MKYLLTILLLFLAAICMAQEPTYNQMRSNYQFRGVRVDSLLLFPKFSDTTIAKNKLGNINGLVIRVGTQFYFRDSAQNKWSALGGSSIDTTSLSNRINSKADTSLLNGVVYFSDTLTSIATKSDLSSPIDTTSLSNRINNKVDSIKRISDSIFYYKNGTGYFSFKDSSGGNLTLNQVTDFGNTTQNNIVFVDDADLQMDTFSSVLLANNSRLQEGTIDAGYGGNKGIAQICGLGYELKWEGGMLFAMGSSGNVIREARYMFNYVPQDTNDVSEGYYVGSRWILDNGDTYECTDNSLNAAVWVLLSNAFDSTSLSNRINQKVDSVKRTGDSVYYYKNGIAFYAFLDSVGTGQNGRWGNDTALVILAKVHNATGTQLNRGEVIYISGANGDVASVKRANNKYDSTSATTIGMVKDNIASGDTGWVVTQGQISKINTSAFSPGDIVYLDSIDGQFTKTKQYAPYHLVFIGVVERANAGNGQIYIKPQNGYELNELHDVAINNPINNQVLVYSDTQQLWKNRNVYSVVDTSSLSNRINAKQNQLNGTGFVKASGTTITYDNNTYLSEDPQILGLQALGSTIKGVNLNVRGWSEVTTSFNLVNQVIYFTPVYLTNPATITGVKWWQVNQGVYNAVNYNGVGLYSYSGGTLTLVASSTNDANIWKGASLSIQSKDFSATYSASAGIYYIALMYSNSSFTTTPAIGLAPNRQNLGLQGDLTNSAKLGGQLTAQSSLPSSQASSGLANNVNNIGIFLY